jgi:hypothetical protein
LTAATGITAAIATITARAAAVPITAKILALLVPALPAENQESRWCAVQNQTLCSSPDKALSESARRETHESCERSQHRKPGD